jgi:hypothetical protein
MTSSSGIEGERLALYSTCRRLPPLASFWDRVALGAGEPREARQSRSWCHIVGRYACPCTSFEDGSGKDVPCSKFSLSFPSLGKRR